MSQEAFAALRRGTDPERVVWLNACDPASLRGSGIEGLKEGLPSRLPSNDVVYHGDRLVLVARRRGKSLQCHVDPGHPRMSDYLSFFKVWLAREFNPSRRITVESVNDRPVLESPYLEDFLRFGFERSVDRVELWKRYG